MTKVLTHASGGTSARLGGRTRRREVRPCSCARRGERPTRRVGPSPASRAARRWPVRRSRWAGGGPSAATTATSRRLLGPAEQNSQLLLAHVGPPICRLRGRPPVVGSPLLGSERVAGAILQR